MSYGSKTVDLTVAFTNGKLSEVSCCDNESCCEWSAMPLDLDRGNRFFAEQFTGLLDANGKEIYEGDICSYNASKLSFYRSQKDCLISFKDEPSFYGYFISSVKGNFSWTLTREFAKDNIEVIGNVHENPDLLADA